MLSLFDTLKTAGQDFEFYPTTREIIRAMLKDLSSQKYGDRYTRDLHSFLDIGAGNGKVLEAVDADEDLRIHTLYAIEKSDILRGQLPADVLVIGTDFREQSLISKEADVTFCNPPYSEFVAWSQKIIRESASQFVYLCIPERWAQNVLIADALAYRKAKAHVVGSYDFEDAEDRRARAKVQLLRITLAADRNDAFERLFDEQFSELKSKFEHKDATSADAARKESFGALVAGENYPEALVALYVAELEKINRNYQAAASLDPELLREFDIVPSKIMACLMARLKGLRMAYWTELFEKMAPITDRLTSESRKRLLERLQKHTAVDFTVSNIYAVIVWALKNANLCIDEQFLDTYEKMVDKANVLLYRSNQKQFVQSGWAYNRKENESSHFALDNRIVMHRCGGICTSQYSYTKEKCNGLEERAHEFLGDLLTVGHNLGFDTTGGRSPLRWRGPAWESNQSQEFFYQSKDGPELFMEVKAFKNGNLHLRISRKVMLALNVEHGRLRGWLRSKEDAGSELEPAAAKIFDRGNHKFLTTSPALCLTQTAA